jgi:hypothetical protein
MIKDIIQNYRMLRAIGLKRLTALRLALLCGKINRDYKKYEKEIKK